jgi:hypothetical protein
MQKVTVASLKAGAVKMLAKYGDIIDDHCGWIPRELVATRIWFETRGNPKAGTHLGEKGLLQLWAWAQKRYLKGGDVTDPDDNIRAGCEMWRDMVGWAGASKTDLGAIWSSSAIGHGATKWLLSQVKAWGHPRDFAGIRDLTEGPHGQTVLLLGAAKKRFGTQSAALVHHRLRVAHYAAVASTELAKERGMASMDLDLVLVGGALVAALVVAAYLLL